jgi:hypothetical protein
MKADIFTEIFLWNKNIDSLVRVLQRLEALGVWPRHGLAGYEARLEEVRALLNADFADRMVPRERLDQERFESMRIAAEQSRRSADSSTKQTKQTKQRKQRKH